MLKNIIILAIIIIGGWLIYTNYIQGQKNTTLNSVVNKEHPG